MNKLIIGIGLGGVVVVGMIVGKYISKEIILTPDIDEELVKVSENINANLPMMVDKDTRLDKTLGESGKKFTYFYTFPSHTSSDIDSQALRDAIAPIVRSSFCNSNDMHHFIKKGVTTNYIYHGNDGAEVTRIVVAPTDCSKPS